MIRPPATWHARLLAAAPALQPGQAGVVLVDDAGDPAAGRAYGSRTVAWQQATRRLTRGEAVTAYVVTLARDGARALWAGPDTVLEVQPAGPPLEAELADLLWPYLGNASLEVADRLARLARRRLAQDVQAAADGAVVVHPLYDGAGRALTSFPEGVGYGARIVREGPRP
jgi:hypothetical protein